MKIVDFRTRPRTEEYLSLYSGSELRDQYDRQFDKFGVNMPPVGALEDFVAEMDESGILMAVYVGRDLESSTGWKLSNDCVAEAVASFPDRIVGFAGIDPLKGKRAEEEVVRSIKELALRGVAIDPFRCRIQPDDRIIYPIYERCVEFGISIIITLGPLPSPAMYLNCALPSSVDVVATDFPDLKIICSHGGWPYTQEMIAVAYRHAHVWVETSLYEDFPGAQLMVEAANTILSEKVLFASGYPARGFQAALELYDRMPFADGIREKIMGENAKKLLGI